MITRYLKIAMNFITGTPDYARWPIRTNFGNLAGRRMPNFGTSIAANSFGNGDSWDDQIWKEFVPSAEGPLDEFGSGHKAENFPFKFGTNLLAQCQGPHLSS